MCCNLGGNEHAILTKGDQLNPQFEENTLTIYAFSRRFYPKRLTVHSDYTFFLSVCVFPGNWTHNLCTDNAMLYHWATGTLVVSLSSLPQRYVLWEGFCQKRRAEMKVDMLLTQLQWCTFMLTYSGDIYVVLCWPVYSMFRYIELKAMFICFSTSECVFAVFWHITP